MDDKHRQLIYSPILKLPYCTNPSKSDRLVKLTSGSVFSIVLMFVGQDPYGRKTINVVYVFDYHKIQQIISRFFFAMD